jgi:hypothetical protein
MSFQPDTKPQDLGPDRLKPVQGTPILDASVEAIRATDLCTGPTPYGATREQILAWLAEGAREVTRAVCLLPRERWAAQPPSHLGNWPMLRHARHIHLHEAHLTMASVRYALGETPPDDQPAKDRLDFEQADAMWDPATAIASAEAILRGLGNTRFELLQRLEAAPDDAWQRLIPTSVAADAAWGDTRPVQLDWVLLSARQHELEHLAAMWRVALQWDRVPRAPIPGVPLHPADRLEESH